MVDKNSEIIELKLINSLLLKELRKSNSEIGEDSNYETIEITQLKQLNSILVKEVAESRIEIEKLKRENEILKSEQDSKNFQSFDDQKNRKRKKPNSSSNAFKIAFSNPTNNDFDNENIKEKEHENFIENKIISNISDNDLNNAMFEKIDSLTDISENYRYKKLFLDEQDLNLHDSTIHKGNKESMEDKKENRNLEKIFIEDIYDKNQPKNVCHICDQKFTEPRSKRKHLKNIHDVETHFLCDVCDKTFSNFSNLQNHKKEHVQKEKNDANNKIACDICGKILSQKHMKSHVKDAHLDLYKCNECDISFIRVELNKHISSVHRSRQNIVI